MPTLSPDPTAIPHPHLPALLRVLAATRTLAAQTTFYAAGLGAVALLAGAPLPPELQFFAGAVGADILAGIITRLAQGEAVPDDEICQQVEEAIAQSDVADALQEQETQAMIGQLFGRMHLLHYALANGQGEIAERLTTQAVQYKALFAELQATVERIDETTIRTEESVVRIADNVQTLLDWMQPQASVGPLIAATQPQAATVQGRIQVFLESYRSMFGGREDEMDALDEWLHSANTSFGLIRAQAGLGKSALVANWVARLTQRSDIAVVYHPISLRYDTHRLQDVLMSLIIQLRGVQGSDDTNLIPDERMLENELVARLQQDASPGAQVLVVIDGLDELDTVSRRHLLLPSKLGTGVHLLVTMRGQPGTGNQEIISQFGWHTSLARVFGLEKLDLSSINSVLQQSGLKLDRSDMDELGTQIYRLSEQGDPLVIRLLVDAILDSHSHRDPAAPVIPIHMESLALRSREPGIEGYLGWITEQLRQTGVDAIPLFDALCVARGPLMDRDICALGVDIKQLSSYQFTKQSRGLIIGDGRKIGYSFAHPKIGYAYSDRYFSAQKRDEWISRFRNYGQRVVTDLRSGTLLPEDASQYVLRYHSSHLLDDCIPISSQQLLGLVDRSWMHAHYAVSHNYEDFLVDVNRAWDMADHQSQADIEAGRPASTLDFQVKCMLCFASVVSLASRLPESLPALLVRDRMWTLQQALSYASRVPNPVQRTDTQLALLNVADTKSQISAYDRMALCSAILRSIRLMQETYPSYIRARMILDLLSHIESRRDIELATEIGLEIRKNRYRVEVLSNVLPRTTDCEVQLRLAEEIVRACTQLDMSYGSDSDRDYAPYLFELVGKVVTPDLLKTLWGKLKQEASTPNDFGSRSDGFTHFLDRLSWHIPGDVAKDFFELLPPRDALPDIARRVARFARRLDDGHALDIACALDHQIRESAEDAFESEARPPFYAYYLRLHGCGLAFVALAFDRQNKDVRDRIISITRQYIRAFGDDERPITGDDLAILCDLSEGRITDAAIARLVRQQKFLAYFHQGLGDDRLPVYAEEIVQYLGRETVKALFRDNHPVKYYSIGDSPYLLANIASRLPASELSWIYEVGTGRYEYTSVGYKCATAQNVARMPDTLRVDGLKWALSNYGVPYWQEVQIAPYIQLDDLKDDGLRSDFLRAFPRIGSSVSPDVARQFFRQHSESGNVKTEHLLALVRWHLPEDERKAILADLQEKSLRIIDTGEQLSALHMLSRAGGRRLSSRMFGLRKSTEKLTYGNLHPFRRPPVAHHTMLSEWMRYRYNPDDTRLQRRKVKDQSYWEQLRSTINAIKDIQDLNLRQQAYIGVHKQLGDTVYHITSQDYWDYAEHAAYVWGDLPKELILEAFRILDAYGTSDAPPFEKHDYVRTIIPPVALFKKDLLPLLNDHIDRSYSQLRAIQYSLVARFLEGKDQLHYLEKAVGAFPSAELPEHVIPWILTETAEYAGDDLVTHLLRWIQQYPYMEPLSVLAPRINWTEERLEIACSIARHHEEKIHTFVHGVAQHLNRRWIGKFLKLLIDRDKYAEQDKSYPALLYHWRRLSTADAYSVWKDVAHHLVQYDRRVALRQLGEFSEIILHLARPDTLYNIGRNLVELNGWWPMSWERPADWYRGSFGVM